MVVKITSTLENISLSYRELIALILAFGVESLKLEAKLSKIVSF